MKTFFILSGLLVMPLFANAVTFETVLGDMLGIVNTAIPLVIALAVLYFFWGLAQYILSQGNEEKKGAGKDIMIWGIIALFVMVSVWGLIKLVQGSFGIDTTTTPIVPGIIGRPDSSWRYSPF